MQLPKLYTDLAAWWPLFSHPDDYADEAAWIWNAIEQAIGPDAGPIHIIELGSGGGNIASHLGRHARLTLVDPSAAMLDVSRALNPGAEHILGDMRTARLGRTAAAVMIHDAIMYMTSEDCLCAALTTARLHLDGTGLLIVLPDCTAETFEPSTELGGRDAIDGARGLRYLAWTHPTAAGTLCETDYAILLRERDGSTELIHDRHTTGLFSRATWCETFLRAGFAKPHMSRDPWDRDIFTARPAPINFAR